LLGQPTPIPEEATSVNCTGLLFCVMAALCRLVLPVLVCITGGSKLAVRVHRTAPKMEGVVGRFLSLASMEAAHDKPKLDGHFLTPTELEGITSVACLEAKQKDPAVQCANATEEGRHSEMISAFGGEVTAANYPQHTNPMCNSHGEFMCDPVNRHTTERQEGREKLAQEMSRLRARTGVVCGRLLNDPVDQRHIQPFYLGVAFIPEWPVSDVHPESLQDVGQLIAADWNMDAPFVGNQQPYVRCPNTAVLLIMPEANQVFLSSSSCEFICATRGGPEVVAKAIEAMRSGGDLEAALVGVREVYSFLAAERENHEVPTEAPVPWGATLELTTFVQRAFFFLAVCGLACAFVLGFLVLLIGPGLIAGRKK